MSLSKLFSSMAPPRIVLSIENGAARILVVKGGRIQTWMTYPLEPDVFKDGLVLAPNLFQTILSSLFFSRDSIRGRIAVCLPGNRSFFRTVALPEMRPHLVAEAMEREAEREMSIDRTQAYLFWEPFGKEKGTRHYTLVGMQREAFGRLRETMQAVRISPHAWDLKPLALARAVGKDDVVIADVGQGATDLVVVMGRIPRLIRSLADPSDLGPKEQGQALAEHVTKTVAYYKTSNPDETWDARTPVVLTGTLAGNAELAGAFRSAIDMPVEPFVCPFAHPREFIPAIYAAAIGLALRAGRPKSALGGRRAGDADPFNTRRVLISSRKAAAIVGFAAATALLVPIANIHTSRAEALAAKQAELTHLQRQVALVKGAQARRADVQGRLNQTTALTRALEDERNSILALGRDIAGDIGAALALMPGTISPTKFITQDGTLVLEGQAPDTATVLGYARTLEQAGRFSSVAVTTLATKNTGDGTPIVAFLLSLSRQGGTTGK